MTAYAVPLYAEILSTIPNGISKILVKGLDLPSIYSIAGFDEAIEDDSDGPTEDDKRDLKEISDSRGDSHYFSPLDAYRLISEFLLTIPPNSSLQIEMVIYTTESVEAEFSVPPTVGEVFCPLPLSQVEKKSFRRRNWVDVLCCYHDHIECIFNGIANLSDWASIVPGVNWGEIVSCASSAVSNFISVSAAALCETDEPLMEKVTPNIGYSVLSTLISCAKEKIMDMVAGKRYETMVKIITELNRLTLNPIVTAHNCYSALTTEVDCPLSIPIGGRSVPLESRDPNDIYGYQAESGSKAIKDALTDVYYNIEFENDPELATAPAHEIVITDQLDGTKFDISTFTPTRVEIGQKSMELKGDKNFVTTIDMRPEIYAIAQVEGAFDESTGLAKWHIVTLDPMTMEPTEDALQGVLPVNTGGNGIGQISFDIKLKEGLAQGTEIPNQATIVFDTNEPITTPTWTNIIDRIAPESHITKVEQVDGGETATVSIEANDELSGVWRYDVYVQYGSGAWFLGAENVAANTTATVKLYEGIEHHFYSVATDMAGNMEQKEAINECSLYVEHITKKGDVNGDGSITAQDASLVQQLVAKKVTAATEGIVYEAADVNGDGAVTAQDASLIQQHVAKKIDLSTINK